MLLHAGRDVGSMPAAPTLTRRAHFEGDKMKNLAELFNAEDLEELCWDSSFDDFTVVQKPVPIDTSRWAIQYEMVFSKDEKFYRMNWEVGATEYQEVDFEPYVIEVFPVEKTITVYEPKK